MSDNHNPAGHKKITTVGELFTRLDPTEAMRPVMRSLRKAMGRAGVLEEEKDEERVKKEEISILTDLEKMGKKLEASSYEHFLFAAGEFLDNTTPGDDKLITEELIDSRFRKAEIRASAEAIAKERGEKIPIPSNVYALSFLIDDSKPELHPKI